MALRDAQVAFKIKACHSGQGISVPIGTTQLSQLSFLVTSWLNRSQIPLCASQHSNATPLRPTFQFQVFPEYKRQGTRKGTKTILSPLLHSLCKVCISNFERICWLGHISDLLWAGQCTGDDPVTWMLLGMGRFCSQILNQIPQKLDSLCSTAFSTKQKNIKQSGDEKGSGCYFLSSKRQESKKQMRQGTLGISACPFPWVWHLKLCTGLLGTDVKNDEQMNKWLDMFKDLSSWWWNQTGKETVILECELSMFRVIEDPRKGEPNQLSGPEVTRSNR